MVTIANLDSKLLKPLIITQSIFTGQNRKTLKDQKIEDFLTKQDDDESCPNTLEIGINRGKGLMDIFQLQLKYVPDEQLYRLLIATEYVGEDIPISSYDEIDIDIIADAINETLMLHDIDAQRNLKREKINAILELYDWRKKPNDIFDDSFSKTFKGQPFIVENGILGEDIVKKNCLYLYNIDNEMIKYYLCENYRSEEEMIAEMDKTAQRTARIKDLEMQRRK